MTRMHLGLFVKKLQPKVGFAGYELSFAYFVVEVKSIIKQGCQKTLKFYILHFIDMYVLAKNGWILLATLIVLI